jgi:predicted dithiol-disulfide oxidoreductase (DUF899 family)
MSYESGRRRLRELREQIARIREEMREVQQEIDPDPVADYTFTSAGGEVRLSQLFGDKSALFVVHNMGRKCPYCTLWADGYNGTYDHLASRAAFVVSSPDPPEEQRTFAASRGWRFPMVSHRGTTFAKDMGYGDDNGGFLPGVSVFKRADGGIFRVSDTGFSELDDFCPVFHFLDLLPEGRAGWRPRFRYG